MKKRAPAFTLIELLAVVAILLILVSLLLPWVGRVIDMGRFVVCMSNVRQITSADVLYTGDNDGMVSGPNWVPTCAGGDVWERGWLHGTNRTQLVGPVALRSGLLWPYIGEERVYRCPADPQVNAANVAHNYPQDTRIITSYIENGSVCAYGDCGRRPYDTTTHLWTTYRIGEFRSTDFIFWEGDETYDNFGDWWDGANSPDQGISRRHYGDNMVGCVDGHGERVSSNEYYTIVRETPARKNRLWNVPNSASGR